MSPPAAVRDPTRLAWRGLVILTTINLLNYLDRYVPAALSESLRNSSLRISDTQFGFLMSGFIVIYMMTAPVLAPWATRGRVHGSSRLVFSSGASRRPREAWRGTSPASWWRAPR